VHGCCTELQQCVRTVKGRIETTGRAALAGDGQTSFSGYASCTAGGRWDMYTFQLSTGVEASQ
jgi:hypothetical protein